MKLWKQFSHFLGRIVTTLWFGIFYLLLVPWFLVIARLLRKTRSTKTYWIERPATTYDETFFDRMG